EFTVIVIDDSASPNSAHSVDEDTSMDSSSLSSFLESVEDIADKDLLLDNTDDLPDWDDVFNDSSLAGEEILDDWLPGEESAASTDPAESMADTAGGDSDSYAYMPDTLVNDELEQA